MKTIGAKKLTGPGPDRGPDRDTDTDKDRDRDRDTDSADEGQRFYEFAKGSAGEAASQIDVLRIKVSSQKASTPKRAAFCSG